MQMWRRLTEQGGPERAVIYSDFRRALTREILLTERLRIKAVIVTASVLVACLLTAYTIMPDNVERILHGHFPLVPLLGAFVIFSSLELSVLRILSPQLAL